MLKKYKAIFFDWDGTAVMSRRAPVDQAVAAMRPLLQKGIKLIIVSGTTIENIAGGKIESYFAEEELKNLYLGLGRGAYNYSFKDGIPYIFKNNWRKCRGLPYTYGYITFPATLSYLILTPASEARCSTIVIISFASLLRSTISLESSIWPSSNLLIWRMSLISDKR